MNFEFLFWALMVAFAGLFFWRLMRWRISPEEARKRIASGAVVLDVRSPGEFANGSLAGAQNLPLGELKSQISAVVPSKETVVLCHCASGARSGAAVHQLRRMGYEESFNLGSMPRAARALLD